MTTRSTRKPLPRRSTLSEQLRAAVEESGKADHYIARAAGLDPSSVSRFMRGERSFTLETAELVAAVLGLALVPVGAAQLRSRRGRGRPGTRGASVAAHEKAAVGGDAPTAALALREDGDGHGPSPPPEGLSDGAAYLPK